MKNLLLLCILSALILWPASLYARDYEGWTVTNFNNENGLPQNSVKFAEMDKDGYLWLATEVGIVRYDGQRFRLFDNSNSALLRNRYMGFGKNSDGNIYCIDDYGQIAYYDAKNGFSKPADLSFLVPASSMGIADLPRSELEKLGPFTGTYRPRLSREYLYHATSSGKGFMVMTTSSVVVAGYVSGGRIRWKDTLKDCHNRIHHPLMDMDGKLCYISQDRHIITVDSNGVRSRKSIAIPFPWHKLLVRTPLISFHRQEHHVLLNLDGDIYEVGMRDGAFTFHHLIEVKDIASINCIRYYPEQGLLVIGSASEGLFLFKQQQLSTIGRNGRKGVPFYALAPYGNNQLLTPLGVSPGFRPQPGISDVHSRNSILRDHNRHYWYSIGEELWETDERFLRLKRVPLKRRLTCLREDELGAVWVSVMESDFGRVQGDTIRPYKLEGIEGKSILSFIPAGNQTFWLVGKGLCLWLDVKHHRQHIYHEFDSTELRTAYLDKQHNLWLGSYGQGYFLFRNGRFTKLPGDEAQYLKVVNCFLEDHNGFIWMTTNNGLFQCAVNDLYRYADKKTGQVYHHYYGKESGLKVSEFNGGCTPSGLQLDNGRFAFPSLGGIVLLHPDSIRPLLPAGKLFIEQVLLDGVPVKDRDLSMIPPSFKRLELIVSSPYFGNPNNLNIEYNIEGFDDRWYPLGGNSRIVLNRLKYGHYKLRLRKMAGFGEGNYITSDLSLVVMPFFYQTWWFGVLVAACTLLFILLIIRVRYKYLILHRNRLEAEVKERTSALVYHNKLMEKLTVMIAHDLKSPLYFLSKVTGHLRRNVQLENLQEIDRASAEIKNTADHVYHFIEGFNLWASSFTEGFTLHKTSFPLEDLLQELRAFFKEMLEANGNKLSIVTPVNYILETDRELLKVILRNIIDNANKHTQDCTISISVTAQSEQYIAITISDTGQGMSKPVLKRIQDRIAQAATAAGIERNSRLGFQMIIDFTMRLGAKLEVQSEPGKGTSVTLLHLEGTQKETSPSEGLAEQVVSAS